MIRSSHSSLIKLAWVVALFLYPFRYASGQDGEPQLGTPGRPNYETFRMDKLTSQGDASYSGDLNLSIPLLVVPGRHGHDFAINISYNSHITQSQLASWVGLGWNLDIGAVERTIQGRADDQDPVYNQQHGYWLGPTPGAFCGPPYRATLYGKMNIRERTLAAADRDQADMYNVIIDGGNTEAHFIPDLITDTTNYNGPYKFLAPQYNKWDIQAAWTPSAGPITAFTVTKEDGSKYVFGQDLNNNGSIDNVELAGKTQDGLTTQQFSSPYRWSLEQITYPDGSGTRVTYKKHNQGTQNSVRRKYASIGIDRSYTWVDNVFSPGINVVPHSQDSVRYWYSSPESLYTDTHYLVFKSSTPSTIDMSDKNRRLDTLILYDRLSSRELKRVLFFYAANPNPNAINNDLNDWQHGTSLANDQLTLDSVSVRTSDDRYSDAIPPFVFTYGKNPRFDLNYNQNGSEGGNYAFPGFRADSVFSTAWRLRSIKYPTGGRTEYSYQRLSGSATDQFKVCYDPEGQYNATNPYSFNATPKCRLAQKRVVDTLGVNQLWTYTYGTAVYDAPNRPIVGTFQPNLYTTAKDPNYGSNFSYYMYYRGCPIGHRWVQVTYPNGSWKKTYFTSSYQAADKDPMESKPDTIVAAQPPPPNNATILFSNYGKRGMIWKEETNLSSTVYYYSYQIQWQYLDPYVYFALCDNNNYSYQIELRSIWPHLDSVRTTTDGITKQTNYTYNPTRISNYGVWNKTGSGSSPYYPGWQAGIAANGLISTKSEKWNALTISTGYQYACSRNSSIDAAFMLSQVYSTKVSDTVDESRDWTTYGQIGSLWLPISRWVWSDDQTAPVAPPDTSTGINVTLMRYTYDGSTCTDVIKTTDANGNVTNFYYSSDTTNPFVNNTSGLAMGRVTGLEKIRGGTMSPLRTSAIYDGYGNAIRLTSENGNVTRCIYDKLGRLTNIVGPNGQTISNYAYSYFASPLQPNEIAANGYRTPSDWTSTRTFYDGIGYEMQKQVSLGSLDIISRTAYDSMRHPAQQFLPFQCDLGGANEHNYDTSIFSRTMAYNPGSGVYPFDLTEYESDPNGRPVNQFYSDTIFSTSNRANNKYTRLSYGANGSGLPDFTSGTLHKTITLDENGNNHISYVDILGNTVISVADSGGRALTTEMEYDPKGRVVNVFTPNSYSPPMSRLSTGSISLDVPQHTGQIDLTGLRVGAKAINVSLFADTVAKAGPILPSQGIRPFLPAAGITVFFHINQYSKGILIAHQDSNSIWDYPDAYPDVSPMQALPSILPESDEVTMVIDTVYWIKPLDRNCSHGTLTLNCGLGGNFSYTYDRRGLNTLKVVPDLGAASLLYDKNGNLRLVKDAAHTSTVSNPNGPVENAIHYSGTISCPNSTSGQFTLTMPGPVTATTHVNDINNSEYVTIKVKANGVYVLSTSSSGFNGSTSTLPLPKGTYTYEVTTTTGSGAFAWDVSCQNGYEFVYYKYDALNRVTEEGEYLSTSAYADFAKGNAENSSFPTSGALTRTMLYDTASTDAIASGQRNLYGKLSQAIYYRLGTLALSTFYSYDDFGRIEWVAYRGFGSNGMKIAYTYDLQNNITKKTFTDYANATNNFMWWYEYDQAGRLARLYSGTDSLCRVKDAEYAYSASGKVTQLNLGVTPAQTMNYTYTDRNWLNTIASSQFWQYLGYNNLAEIGLTLNSPAQYNGNVSWMSYSERGNSFHWGPPHSTDTLGYTFKYDSTNRLTAANFGFKYNGWSAYNSYNMPKIDYDKNGNIDTLVRYGSNATLMDNLKYHYLGNTDRLDYITDWCLVIRSRLISTMNLPGITNMTLTEMFRLTAGAVWGSLSMT
jgi:YD repeat-containing protein